MKLVLVISTFAALAVAADGGPAVAWVEHDKVAAAIVAGSVMVSQPGVTVQGGHRIGPGQVEVHDKETDVLFIVEGEATLVTGGTMVGGKVTAPGQTRGTSIEGGKTQHLSKGDVIVIPAGIPHWFTQVTAPALNYYVVKSVKP